MQLLPPELVSVIARYVHDEKDDEKLYRFYTRIDTTPVTVYDTKTDSYIECHPMANPYYRIECIVYRTQCLFHIDSQHRLTKIFETFSEIVYSSSRIVDQDEFDRLRNNNVVMSEGICFKK